MVQGAIDEVTHGHIIIYTETCVYTHVYLTSVLNKSLIIDHLNACTEHMNNYLYISIDHQFIKKYFTAVLNNVELFSLKYCFLT